MMKWNWSKEAWYAVAGIYAEILKLPFIQKLVNGTLDKEKFLYYIRQDSLYIADFCKVLAVAASRMADSSHRETLLGFASECVAVENALHEKIFAEYGIEKFLIGEQSPTCLMYTSFLHRQTSEPVEVMMASLLPCFWIYKEVAFYCKELQTGFDNPYAEWIDTYSNAEYSKSVKKAVSICDTLAAECTNKQREAMTEVFMKCSRMEWMFWNSAYLHELWRV